MSAMEHMQAAETLLDRDHDTEPTALELVIRAQAHASLALAHLEYERQLAAEIAGLPEVVDNDQQEEAVK